MQTSKFDWTSEQPLEYEFNVIYKTFPCQHHTNNSKMFLPTWEPKIAQIVSQMVFKNKDERERPILVGVVGMPGSGKTTSSSILASVLEENYNISSIVLPMDGYHFPISYLKTMEDPEDVIYRRGAPDTFDANSLREHLFKIRNGSDNVVSIPGFDHEVGDPNPNEHLFKRESHQVVIVEGLYLLHEDNKFGWNGIKVSYPNVKI